jgi:cytochrome c-type biogenesis protein CcmE
MKVAVPGLLILIGMVSLIWMGIVQGAIPEVGVQGLQTGQFAGRQVRLQGVIEAIETDVRPMRFTIRDLQDPEVRYPVIVDDHRPDIFKPDTDVAVIGILDPETGVFEGTKIFTKCPSKYEASDPGSMGSVAARSGESVPPEDPPIDPE